MTEGTGYKRPPVASRWKKGQSGNPSGRKRGSLNLRTDLIAELEEVIQINEGGSPRRITKQRALLKSLAARGIQGDARAANLILNLMLRVLDPETAPAGAAEMAAEDKAILDAYLAKHLSKKDETR
ncbi:MAG TPA: DUF5681 domain-containing protein [Allosphingosinicella sp.]|nr:DUF5681 domain-containing protein [Allosphingosinicella sp.]